MKLKDHDLWISYTKIICKSKNDNVVPKLSKHSYQQVEHKIEERLVDISTRTSEVILMTRKEKRKFREEARIDLHFLTRNMVDSALLAFCTKCISLGIRNVTIITGKGEGIVRLEAANWIKSSPSYVISFSPITDIVN